MNNAISQESQDYIDACDSAPEFADEQLNASLTSTQVTKAVTFLESVADSNTLALRAIVAAMCEQGCLDQARIVESIIGALAAQEAKDI